MRRRARLLTQVVARLAVRELPGGGRAAQEGQGRTHERVVEIRRALERLGPLYIKMGQILSTRPDLVPPSLAKELENLHDRVPVVPFGSMAGVLAEELGAGWAADFAEFDRGAPLGTASLAQAYRAVLHDGRAVVVKVQRPGIQAVLRDDMRLLRFAARTVGKGAPVFSASMDVDAMLGVVFEAMRSELDFTQEAANMDQARGDAERFPGIEVPHVLHATPRVLIQSMAPGTSIRDADPTAFKDEEKAAIGTQLLAFMYRGYFVSGTFHADPHPGNVFVCPGGPTTVIDWGMVGRVDRRMRTSLVQVLLGLARNDGQTVARAWGDMGRPTPWADFPGFEQDMAVMVPRIAAASLERLNFGSSLGAVLAHSTQRGIQTSPMIALLGKSFANIEGSVRYLAPQLSVTDVFTEQMRTIVFAYAREAVSEEQLVQSFMELFTASQTAVGDLRSIVHSLATGSMTVQTNAVQRKLSLVENRMDARLRHGVRTLIAAVAVGWWAAHRRTP
ncbi:ABC1 kinase family protein [Streptomyces enissocaesilis]|uniref:AarF/UbiB family protein n=1 Tax=Streptomyces enissocaesilis TaxID=332589 RepID=A0ABP6K5S7_9ACTN